jgi:hypothetical protein
MANKTRKKTSTADERQDLRMKRFIDSVIEEIEEAGIDDEHAADEADEPTSARVTSSVGFSRTRRPQSA